MRSSTASLILAFCASMAVQAAPLTSEGNAALINRDVEENDVELQEATLSKKRSVGGFAYHASSNMIEARNPHLEEKKKELKADELSSDSSGSDSDSDSDSDFEDGPGKKGTQADAGLSNYSASSSLDADSADSFDDDYSANSFDAEDYSSFDAEDYSSFDAEDSANSFDAEDSANSFDAEDAANSLNAGVPLNLADAAASGGAPTDKLTAAEIPSGEDSGEPPKNAAESTVQANADVEQSPGSIDNKLAAASNDNLQANTEAANNNLKTDANSQGDVLEKRDPSKKKNRKSRKSLKKILKKTKGGKKYKIKTKGGKKHNVKKCKIKNGRTKCK